MDSYKGLFKNYEDSLKKIKREVRYSNLEESWKKYYKEEIEKREQEIETVRSASYLSLISVKKVKVDIAHLLCQINIELIKHSKPVNKSISLTSALKTAVVDFLAGFELLHHKD